jgi:hypothetical protein
VSLLLAFQSPPPSVTVLPTPSFPDRGFTRATPATAHDSFAVAWSTSSVPSAVYPDKGTSVPNRQYDQLAAWQWIAEATFQPNPQAVYVDKGTGKPPAVTVHDPPTPEWVNPALFQPTPAAGVYPDKGTGAPDRQYDQLGAWRWINPAIDQPNPGAVYPDRGTGKPAPAAAHEPPVSQWQNPALFQPNPGAVFPDRGNTLPWRSITEGSPYVAPPVVVVVVVTPPVYPDKGTAQPDRQPEQPTWLRVDPAADQPIPGAVYPDKGTGRAPASVVFELPTPEWITPALFQPTPSGSFPERGHAVAHRQYDEPGPLRIDPALSQPNPQAVYPDKGTGRPFLQYDEPAPLRIDPASYQPIPSGSYPERGHALPHRQYDEPGPLRIDPAGFQPPSPAVYPDRGTGRPFVQYDEPGPRWQDPGFFQPIPSAALPHRGIARPNVQVEPPSPVVFPPPAPPYVPVAWYPDRGHGAWQNPQVDLQYLVAVAVAPLLPGGNYIGVSCGFLIDDRWFFELFDVIERWRPGDALPVFGDRSRGMYDEDENVLRQYFEGQGDPCNTVWFRGNTFLQNGQVFQEQVTGLYAVTWARPGLYPQPPSRPGIWVPLNLTGYTLTMTAKYEVDDQDNQAVFQIDSASIGGVTVTNVAIGKFQAQAASTANATFADGLIRLIYDVRVKDPSARTFTGNAGYILVPPSVTRALT